jgi:hypothetical protein
MNTFWVGGGVGWQSDHASQHLPAQHITAGAAAAAAAAYLEASMHVAIVTCSPLMHSQENINGVVPLKNDNQPVHAESAEEGLALLPYATT